jgi:hypothetical protein
MPTKQLIAPATAGLRRAATLPLQARHKLAIVRHRLPHCAIRECHVPVLQTLARDDVHCGSGRCSAGIESRRPRSESQVSL